MNRFQYLLQFFRDPKVAALGPTSKRVVDEVCSGISKERDLEILELGPGDGIVTRRLLEELSEGSRILAIETNQAFCDELEALNDPRLTVVRDRAENFPERMKEFGFERFDRIISGIPCSMLNEEQRFQLVVDFHRSLVEGGRSILYQLSPLMKGYVREFLELEEIEVKRNGLLPMFIMKGLKKYSKDPVERDKGGSGPEG